MSAPKDDPRIKALSDAAQVIAHQLDIALRYRDTGEASQKLAPILDELAKGRNKRSQQLAHNVERAAELQAKGHSVLRIAQIMTKERNDPDPQRPAIHTRSVNRWLAKAKTGTD